MKNKEMEGTCCTMRGWGRRFICDFCRETLLRTDDLKDNIKMDPQK